MTNEKDPVTGVPSHDDKSHDSRSAQLSAYLSRGWALVPLHEVHVDHDGRGGMCSCRQGAECRSAGKHPRAAEWQRPEHLVRDDAGLTAALQRWPSCNWGLATGLISGCWALDFDPRHVTDPVAVGAVLAECFATAAWIQGTPSGGVHFVFALPEDFVPNNGAGQLPAGFDVRGARRGEAGGGQIAVAPSVTAVGRYEVLRDTGGALTLAPVVVTAMVRPAPPRVRPTALPLSTPDQNAVTKYAVAGISGELEGLRQEASRRNDRAWRAAARVQELANGAGLDREQVYAAWWAAAASHPDPTVTVPDRELLSVWSSAERTVGDRPADLSSVGGSAGWSFGGVGIVPFAVPGAAPLSDGAASGGGSGGVAGIPPAPMLGGTGQGGTAGGTVPDGGGTGPGQGPGDPVLALLAKMLTPEMMRLQAPPEPLINGVLDLDSTAWLIGKSGSYKSFVALDFAAHIGRGEDWRGHRVRQGTVVYVVAEGARGMRLRVDAWEREYGPIKDVLFLPEPVQADERRAGTGGGAWSVLIEACRRLRPALVVIDTQARVTIGLNENDNGEMSYYAEQADRIKRATGACVLTVHHLGRSGNDARGASAIDGAQDAELRVERTGAFMIKVHADKQKDQEESAPITIRLRRSEGGTDAGTGRDLSSLVLDHAEVPMLGEGADLMPVGQRRALALFQLLHDLLREGGEGITRAEIRALFNGLPEIAEMPTGDHRRKAWTRTWAFLLSRGRVMRYGTSQRFAVFPPPDGSADGMLTMNTGGPEDAPPDGWSIHWPQQDAESYPQAVDNPVDKGGTSPRTNDR
jgi:hypothetical protein